jgi:sulfoxide reductase catalytic subunit YedY
LQTSIYAATGLVTAGAYRFFRGNSPKDIPGAIETAKFLDKEPATIYNNITNYNNFYEFSTDKEDVAEASKNWNITKWNLKVEGLVDNPLSLSLEDISDLKKEERIYRFRCVEGWSMVIPWMGFSLQELLNKAKPQATAKYVAFESYYDEKDMPNAKSSGINFPYVEGLRLDEALHPLTFIATGIYNKKLTNQNGAPIRLVVPWKYGFKSSKSIVRIILTDKMPPTSWNIANPREYGFYSNVNPEVDHPRWSQAKERRIGELGLRKTLMFNGYGSEVAQLYSGMDLRTHF